MSRPMNCRTLTISCLIHAAGNILKDLENPRNKMDFSLLNFFMEF